MTNLAKRNAQFQEASSRVPVEVLGRRETDAPDGGSGGDPVHNAGPNYRVADGNGITGQRRRDQGGDAQRRFRRFSEVQRPEGLSKKKISGHNVPSAFPDIIILIIMAMHGSQNTFSLSTALNHIANTLSKVHLHLLGYTTEQNPTTKNNKINPTAGFRMS